MEAELEEARSTAAVAAAGAMEAEGARAAQAEGTRAADHTQHPSVMHAHSSRHASACGSAVGVPKKST